MEVLQSKIMRKVLKINRSTYYKVANHKPSDRALENQKLDEAILEIYYDVKRRYGAPKLHQILLLNGWHISLKRV